MLMWGISVTDNICSSREGFINWVRPTGASTYTCFNNIT